jgi:hypothetical protein
MMFSDPNIEMLMARTGFNAFHFGKKEDNLPGTLGSIQGDAHI